MYKRYRFFKDNAGYVGGQRAVSALQLAKAEKWAENVGMVFVWSEDAYANLGDHAYWCKDAARRECGYGYNPYETCEHSIEECVAKLDGAVVASLSGIIDADTCYRRVVEAELALEEWNKVQECKSAMAY